MISDIKESKRLCFVGQDLYKSGMAAGGLMKLLVAKGEKIACIVGSSQFLAHRERLNGFRERFLQDREESDIVAVLENGDSSKKSKALIEQLLTSFPELKGIFIAGAGVEGICQVVKERGLSGKIKMISYDLIQSGDYCRQGVLDFVIDQDPFEEGYRALTVLNNYIMLGEKPKDRMLTKVDIRTIDTIDL
jgi:LacI family transcriptional regulator